ncbi:MAG: hypothetical protein H0U56_15630 [Methylibium sp.]|nr:hypothetical protein [Methylibium sp.]
MQEKKPEAAEAKATEVVRLTPTQWAERKGMVKAAAFPWEQPRVDARHAAADSLHAWGYHAYHYQAEPLLLTEQDYDAALKAAAEFPLELPHKPAISPHSPHSYPDQKALRTPRNAAEEKSNADELERRANADKPASQEKAR